MPGAADTVRCERIPAFCGFDGKFRGRRAAGNSSFAGVDAEKGSANGFCMDAGFQYQLRNQNGCIPGTAAFAAAGIFIVGVGVSVVSNTDFRINHFKFAAELEIDVGGNAVGCTGQRQIGNGKAGGAAVRNADIGSVIVQRKGGGKPAGAAAAVDRAEQSECSTYIPGAYVPQQEEVLRRKAGIDTASFLDFGQNIGNSGCKQAVGEFQRIYFKTVDSQLLGGNAALRSGADKVQAGSAALHCKYGVGI